MTVYSRSDRTAIGGVPGCDQQHERPADLPPGAPWGLTCPAHEAWIKGDRKPKILMHKIEGGRVVGQERIADMEPGWSTTPETIPLTPDEERTNKTRQERGAQQIQMIQALAALNASGIEVPPEAMWLLERELPAGILKGTMVCASGHDNQAGVKFCGECGISMAARAAVEPPAPELEEPDAVDLHRVHVNSLRKMCRQRGLPDKGSKDQLISRLAA